MVTHHQGATHAAHAAVGVLAETLAGWAENSKCCFKGLTQLKRKKDWKDKTRGAVPEGRPEQDATLGDDLLAGLFWLPDELLGCSKIDYLEA